MPQSTSTLPRAAGADPSRQPSAWNSPNVPQPKLAATAARMWPSPQLIGESTLQEATACWPGSSMPSAACTTWRRRSGLNGLCSQWMADGVAGLCIAAGASPAGSCAELIPDMRDDRQQGGDPAHLGDGAHAVLARHQQVDEGQVEGGVGHGIDAGLPVGGDLHMMAVTPEDQLDAGAHGLFIVDYQDAGHLCLRLVDIWPMRALLPAPRQARARQSRS